MLARWPSKLQLLLLQLLDVLVISCNFGPPWFHHKQTAQVVMCQKPMCLLVWVRRLQGWNCITKFLGFVDPLVVVVVESYFKMEIWCLIHSFNGKILKENQQGIWIMSNEVMWMLLISHVVLNLSIVYMHNMFKDLGFMVLFWPKGGIVFRLLCWGVPYVWKILVVSQSKWLCLKRKKTMGANPSPRPLSLIKRSVNKYPWY